MKRSTKILLTGTTSCGKTRLIDALAEMYLHQRQKVIIIPEVAREVLTNQPELEKDPQLQDILFAEQTHREILATRQSPDIILLDRGVLDIVAHAQYFGQAIKPEWQAWMSQAYDQVLWLNKTDIDFQVTALQQQLGERDWSKSRDELDEWIGQTVQESGLPWRTLSGSIEERVKVVEGILQAITLPEGNRNGRKEQR